MGGGGSGFGEYESVIDLASSIIDDVVQDQGSGIGCHSRQTKMLEGGGVQGRKEEIGKREGDTNIQKQGSIRQAACREAKTNVGVYIGR